MNVLQCTGLLLIAVVTTAALRLPGIRFGLNTADEGYLLYGTRELLKRKVPIRDYRAYDPGRYFWCAVWMKRLGSTFFVQRLAMSAVITITLWLVGSLIFAVADSWLFAWLVMLIAHIWIRPYFKSFEILFSITAVCMGYLELSEPNSLVLTASGINAGMAFFWGLNLGLYVGLATIVSWIISLFINQMSFFSSLWAIAFGGLLGISPLIFLALRHRGFLSAYGREKVLTVFQRGSTNLTLEYPWFWTSPRNLQAVEETKRPFLKAVFTLVPFLYIAGIVVSINVRTTSPNTANLLLSSSIVGIAYLHHLFSRSDLSHLCQSIHPFIVMLAGMVLPVGFSLSLIFMAMLLAVSIWAVENELNVYARYLMKKFKITRFEAEGEHFFLPATQASLLKTLRMIINKYSDRGDSVFFAPVMPGYYPLFNRKSAVYDVYCVYPQSAQKQNQMIADIQKYGIRLAVVLDVELDHRKELRFQNTHPSVWRFLQEHFYVLPALGLPEDMHVFVATSEE